MKTRKLDGRELRSLKGALDCFKGDLRKTTSQVAEFSFKLLLLGGNRHSDMLIQLNGLEGLHCTAITTS